MADDGRLPMLEKHPLETTTEFTIRRIRAEIIEECAKHLEHEADIATNSLHCGDNSQTIAATHRISRAYHEAAKSIRTLAKA